MMRPDDRLRDSSTVATLVAALALPPIAGVAGRGADTHGAPAGRRRRCRAPAPMPLIGYGLVVGLNKTGDRRQTIFSAQTLANMLERFGVLVPGEEIKIENVAAVLVTAELPAFSRRGAASTSPRRRSATRAACRAARCCRRRCAAPTARSTRSRRARCRSAASAAARAATPCR